MTEPAGNVVAFTKQAPEGNVGPVRITNVYEMTRFVQSCIRESKMKYKVIAKKADCCPSTVSKLASGYTKDPRTGTCIRILLALGRSIYVH